MDAFLIVIALIAGVVGVLMLSHATAGVGLICLGCLLAIFARIAQSHRQHAELIKPKLEERSR